MEIKERKPQTTIITVRDRRGGDAKYVGKSHSITIHGTSAKELFGFIQRAIKENTNAAG